MRNDGFVLGKRTFFLDPDETFEAARRILRECQHHIQPAIDKTVINTVR